MTINDYGSVLALMKQTHVNRQVGICNAILA